MVGANTFREPALTAKMATTLDHISRRPGDPRHRRRRGSRTEHEAFGLEFGDGFPERLRWLGEALPIMRGMLHGERPTATGPRYTAKRRPQRPAAGPGAPAAAHRRRRRAGHAQARRPLRRREQRRRRHRERPAQGGDPAPALRDGRARPGRDRADDRASARSSSATRAAEAERVHARDRSSATAAPSTGTDQPVGTPEDVAERLAPYLEHRLPPPHRRASRRRTTRSR